MEPINVMRPPAMTFAGIKRTFKTAFTDRMRCASPVQSNETTDQGNQANGPSNRERKREMKFQAKQLKAMQTTQISNCMHEANDQSSTTEDDEAEEDGTGNTGKPKRPTCWFGCNPSESDEQTTEDIDENVFSTARKMETLFEAQLLTTETSKGRGGCEGLRF